MNVAWKIFVRDLKRIIVNPVAVVIAIGVCLIPCIYAWFNILANWDPYENTSTVPVAVAILDEGADVSDLGYTNAGDMVREQLEENTQLGWTFVSEDEAVEGVKAGAYYAAFVIPADFTASLADVLDGDTNQAHIAYYVNEKANAISPKVTDTGSTTLENQISSQFVALVGETVTEKLQDATGGITGSLDEASSSVAADLSEVEGLVDGLADDLSEAQSTISGMRSTIAQARTTLSELSGTATSLASTLAGSLDSLSSTRSQAQTLASQLSAALGSGASTISGVSSRAATDIGAITTDVGWAQGKLDGAISSLSTMNGFTFSNLMRALDQLWLTVNNSSLSDDTKTSLKVQIEEVEAKLQSVQDATSAKIDELQAVSDSIEAGNESVRTLSDSVNNAIQSGASSLTSLQNTLAGTTLPQLSSALDSFSAAGGQLVGTANSIAPMLSQADGTLAELDATLVQSADALGSTAESLHSAADKVGTLVTDVSALESAENLELLQDVLDLDAEQVGDFMGSPVEMVSEAVYPVENYGSGVTPFYTNLALWVGGFVLVAIYKLEVDDEGIGRFKPWQGFFGRWLLLNLLGQLQAIVCCVGDILLGIQCLDPVAFVFAGMVESFVYVFFIYAISVAFKHIGKAIGVLLVILQIPGASGTYPIEMMPGFFQALHPWLPFTYGINAMREAIAGYYGGYYAYNLFMLALFLIPGLLIGVAARRHLLNVNALFDRRLGETDLMITERVGMEGARFRLSTIVKVILSSGDYKEAFLTRAASFELAYPVLVRRGFAALIWVPLVLLALMFILPAKFALLICWILSLVIICTLLIVVEYFHARVFQKTELADMSREELYELLDEELRQEFMAFAPIDKMKLERDARIAGTTDTAASSAKTPEGAPAVSVGEQEPIDVIGANGGSAGTPGTPDTTADSTPTSGETTKMPHNSWKGGDRR